MISKSVNLINYNHHRESAYRKAILVGLLFFNFIIPAIKAEVITITEKRNYLFISGKFIEIYEDRSDRFQISDISSSLFADSFNVSSSQFPVTDNPNSSYWIRFTVHRISPNDKRNFIIELYDPKADHFEIYLPDGNSSFTVKTGGDIYPFSYKTYNHKNFVYDLPIPGNEPQVYYLRFKASHPTGTIGAIKSYQMYAGYAVNEYYLIALFYGIILAMSVFNLLMFVTTKDKPYLYYVLYIVSLGLYGLSKDGTGFQYLWPHAPIINQFITELSMASLICWLLQYARTFLNLKVNAPLWDKIILTIIFARIAIFVVGMTFIPSLRYTTFVETIPIVAALASGIVCLRKGYKPARYYVIAFTLLCAGYFIARLQELELIRTNLINVYSFNIGGALEMLLLSLALADRIKNLTREKEQAQQEVIVQLKRNEEIKDEANRQLENKVAERTSELMIKNEELNTQNDLLEQKTDELQEAYQQLKEQAEEIDKINKLLNADNQVLTTHVNELVKARVMQKEVNYDEFKKIFPDDETCLSYLYQLKEERGYSCKKCSNKNFFKGKEEYSRRCTKCGYNESVTSATIFQKLKFPIVKAFYLVFLVYAHKEKINSTELSQILSLRQSTCWAFSKKVLEALKFRKKASEDGWVCIIFASEDGKADIG